MQNLIQVYKKHKSDKGSLHSYMLVYNSLFAPYKNSEINLLEVGVLQGHSILMWQEYFTKAKIFGVDINFNPKLGKKLNNRSRILIGESAKINIRDYTKDDFDIIIDDGNHDIGYQVKTFDNLFPLLNKGGMYVIEDIQNLESSINILKSLYSNCEIIDHRKIKKRYDDVLVIFRKDI